MGWAAGDVRGRGTDGLCWASCGCRSTVSAIQQHQENEVGARGIGWRHGRGVEMGVSRLIIWPRPDDRYGRHRLVGWHIAHTTRVGVGVGVSAATSILRSRKASAARWRRPIFMNLTSIRSAIHNPTVRGRYLISRRSRHHHPSYLLTIPLALVKVTCVCIPRVRGWGKMHIY
jgi:hypothetical protein